MTREKIIELLAEQEIPNPDDAGRIREQQSAFRAALNLVSPLIPEWRSVDEPPEYNSEIWVSDGEAVYATTFDEDGFPKDIKYWMPNKSLPLPPGSDPLQSLIKKIKDEKIIVSIRIWYSCICL